MIFLGKYESEQAKTLHGFGFSFWYVLFMQFFKTS